MKPVFQYLNYRDFLRDSFAEKKARHRYYSYSLLSQKAGFKSPNYIKLIIESKRNLTKKSIFKVCKALGLKKQEAEYFEHLVYFNQSKSLEEKTHYLKPLMKLRDQDGSHTMERDEFQYLSRWYHPVVRELACNRDFKGGFKALAQSVVPAISTKEAEASVRMLENIGYIVPSAGGGYEMSSINITTGPQLRSLAVSNYHREMITLASESIERFSAAKRNVTSLTLSLSNKSINTIAEKLNHIRQELLLLAEEDKEADNVMQINFQMFPLSTSANKGESE